MRAVGHGDWGMLFANPEVFEGRFPCISMPNGIWMNAMQPAQTVYTVQPAHCVKHRAAIL